VVQQHKTLLLLYVRLARMGLSGQEVQRFLTTIAARLHAKPPSERTTDENEVLAEIGQLLDQGAGAAVAWRAQNSGKYTAVWQLLAELDEAVRASLAGQSDDGEAVSLAVYQAGLRENNLFVVLIAGSSCVTGALLKGQLRRGRQLGEEVLQHALARRGALPEPASIALHSLAWIAFERDELDRCEELLQRVRAVDPNPTSTNMPISTAILTARLQGARGQGAAAQATLQATRELHVRRPSGLWADQDILAYQAWLAVRGGDSTLAQTLLAGGSAQPHALSDLVRAELLLAQGQPGAGAAILQGLLAQYPLHLPREPHLRTHILLAQALFAQGQAHQARRLLASSVRSAAPEGYVRPFIDYAAPVSSLLGLVLQQENLGGEAREFVRRLLAQTGYDRAQPDMHDADAGGRLAALAALTPREQEVLHLLAAGHTNAEIARRLFIAESTVKTHLANIYTKLRVDNRVAAAAWVRG
jgi:LuxR family maltose regulon positive regulatory protein